MLIVIDNFLDTESDTYKKVKSEKSWSDGKKFAGISNKAFGWMNKDGTPSNAFEEVSVKIWRYAKNYMPFEYDGMEYWYNQLDKGQSLPTHQDKDEALHQKTGELVHPVIRAVYYCHKELPTGGFLQIERERSRELERIQPVPNRLVVFDSSNYHSVSEIRHGVRRHLATNIWVKKPDEDNYKSERY